MTREEREWAIGEIETNILPDACDEAAERALGYAIEALRDVPDTNVGKWIPCDSEVSGSLIHRIAEYFREWDGSTPAPTMQVHIDDLRTICQWNTERCALREELKKQNADWIPCSERLPDDDGFYLATILNGLGYTTTQKLLFNGKGWCTAMPWEILAWMRQSDEEKAKSVCKILSLCTHNGITEDDLLMMLDWCFHEMYTCEKPCFGHKERCECLRVIKGVE